MSKTLLGGYGWRRLNFYPDMYKKESGWGGGGGGEGALFEGFFTIS